MATVTDRIKNLLVDQLGLNKEEVEDTSKSWSDLGADELDIVEIIMACEEEFNVTISEEESDNATTVNKLIETIESKLK
jgi:acyl carrier protein